MARASRMTARRGKSSTTGLLPDQATTQLCVMLRQPVIRLGRTLRSSRSDSASAFKKRPMVAIRTQLARALRAQVFLLAGGKCARCSAIADLQVHCLVADRGRHHTYGSSRRWTFYLALFKTGQAVLLCRSCHSRQTTSDLRRARALRRAASPSA